jgi:epoxide hydrolase-like predicted phosphatase
VVKFIIFDFGGVFVTNGIKAARKIFSKKLKVDLEKFWFEEMKSYWNKLKTGKISEDYFWKKFKEKLKKMGKDFDEDEFKKTFFKYQKKNKKVANIIENLRKKGYRTAILSNNVRAWMDEYNKRDNLKKYFDVIVSSDEIGYAKPSKKIYEIFLKKVGAKPEDCIFVDDKERNLKTAEKIGMKTIVFKGVKHFEKELNKLLPG